MDSNNFHKYLSDKMFKIMREDYYGINSDTHCEKVNEILTELTNYINDYNINKKNQSIMNDNDIKILQQLNLNIVEFMDIRNYQIKK